VEGVAVSRWFITGHTGFKGAWLCLALERAGIDFLGYSHDTGELAAALGWKGRPADDVRDLARLKQAMRRARPRVVVHLAAVSLVRRAAAEPRTAWEVNVQGTVHLLEAVRATPSVEAVLVVTTDKCYEPRVDGRPHREGDRLGGRDPYSASKAAAELAVASYRATYFPVGSGVCVATARAGNVVGGGDRGEDRLIPDCVRALAAGTPVRVRNPRSIRPWQHILDVIAGYQALVSRQLESPAEFARAFNFGPPARTGLSVAEVADIAIRTWGAGRWEHAPVEGVAETPVLRLDASLARKRLNWKPKYGPAEAVRRAVAWERERLGLSPAGVRALCTADLEEYLGSES
jgi:CDP-glucose 4,6-dehydratase